MKKLYIVLFIIPFCVAAQNPNTKNIFLKYTQPPSDPLPKNVGSYYSEIINNTPKLLISIDKGVEQLKLNNYRRALSKEESDFLIRWEISSVSYESSIKKVNYKKKINDSTYVKVVGTQYEVIGFMNSKVYIKDIKNDQVLVSRNGAIDMKTYTSKIFNTYNAAVYALNEQKGKQARELYLELYESQLEALINEVNDKYGFIRKDLVLPIARGKGRKHDYSDLQNAFDEFDQLADIFSNEGLIEIVEKKLQTCIQAWSEAIQEYQPKTRKARIGDKNIGHLYFNMASAYFILQEWDKVYDALLKVKETKGQKSLAATVEEITKKLQKRYNLQNG